MLARLEDRLPVRFQDAWVMRLCPRTRRATDRRFRASARGPSEGNEVQRDVTAETRDGRDVPVDANRAATAVFGLTVAHRVEVTEDRKNKRRTSPHDSRSATRGILRKTAVAPRELVARPHFSLLLVFWRCNSPHRHPLTLCASNRNSWLTMAGLESIALAVLHLERAASNENLAAPATASQDIGDIGVVSVVGASQVSSITVLPKRTGFSGPRLVSTDYSMVADTPLNLAPSLLGVGMQPAREDSTRTMVSTTEFVGRALPPLSLQASFLTVPATSLETAMEMDLLDANTKETPPAPKPTDVISFVLKNDVLCGRGGETNHHAGNIQYRQLVKACQPSYIAAKRRDKPKIAERIVRIVRKLGGRFLKKIPDTNTWKDVGNTKAREKTSQALREGAPELRHDKRLSLSASAHIPSFGAAIKPRLTVPRGVQAALVGDMDSLLRPPPSKKLKTISLAQLANVAAEGMTSKLSPSVRYAGALPLSPGGFTATISADDEEDSKSDETKSSSRGPRLKLLKRRLECKNSSV